MIRLWLSAFFDQFPDDECTQQNAADCEHCHHYENDPISGQTAEGVKDTAVNRVHESAGEIADKGSHGHGRTGDLTGNGNFVHRSKINCTHAVDTGADAQCDRHTGSDSHALVRQEGKDPQYDGNDHETDPKVFCGRVERLVSQETAHRSAYHFQTVLIDDAVYADQRSRKRVSVFKEGNKIGKSAVNTVYEKDIKGDKPDAPALERLDHAFPCLFEKRLPGHIPVRMREDADKYEVGIAVYQTGAILAGTEPDRYMQTEAEITGLEIHRCEDFDMVRKLDVNECLITGEPDDLEAIEPVLTMKYRHEAQVFHSEPWYLEVTPQNVDKAYGLKHLLKVLDIPREAMVCCGDSYNDIAMIQYAGVGAAMANGTDRLKAVRVLFCS